MNQTNEKGAKTTIYAIPVEIVSVIADYVRGTPENPTPGASASMHHTCRLLHSLTPENMRLIPNDGKLAEEGYLSLLRWTNKRFGLDTIYDVCGKAARNGHLNVLKWAVRHKYKCGKSTVISAASGGHPEVLKWLRRQGYAWNQAVCAAASQNGHLEVLKWAIKHGCPWGTSVLSDAAMAGQIHILEWVYHYIPKVGKKWCYWNGSIFESAARYGHIEVLKWAREHGCRWNPYTCAITARKGQLETLKWLRSPENNCPWDLLTCTLAAQRGHLEVLTWAVENGCPWDKARCAYLAVHGIRDSIFIERKEVYRNILDWIAQCEIHSTVSDCDFCGSTKVMIKVRQLQAGDDRTMAFLKCLDCNRTFRLQ